MNYLYELDYTTITGRECRAQVVGESDRDALEIALAGLEKEGIKVAVAQAPYRVHSVDEKRRTLHRLDTN